MLEAGRAIPLGLAVSEVAANALRHTCRVRETGRVNVEALAVSSGLIVRVSGDEVGMKQQGASAGLGSRIIRALAATYQLRLTSEASRRTASV